MTDGGFRRSVLPSGITLLTETVPDRRSVAVGVWVRRGARDEPREQLGITHFIEHMMFKGTERRDARAIAQSLEALGGHLDAFTSREQVCYYARALSEHLADVVDVLADITCRSRFASPELEREKSVVREEIFSCEDNPEDRIHDLLGEQLWGDHALGRPILGTVATVDALDRDMLDRHFRSQYRPEELVVAAAGDLSHDALGRLVERHFEPPAGEPLPASGDPPAFHPSVRHATRDDLQQLYLLLGTRGVAYTDAARYPLVVLHTLLGGGMSSRLFQSVREDAGLAYSVFSACDFHRDCGSLTIQLGVAPGRGREALARVREELARLRDEGPTEEEVESARQQLRGGIVMSQESVSNRMVHVANEELYCGRYEPAEEQVARVLAVTVEEVAAAARRYLDPPRFALTALGPAPAGPLSEHDWPAGAGSAGGQ